MKYYILLLICLFISCNSNLQNKIPSEILTQSEFVSILKKVQLAESSFEINKHNNIEDATNQLANDYAAIYHSHEIKQEDFKKSLEYYIKKPELLEKVYAKIMEEIEAEKAILNR